jgi:hypothetical protein
MSLLYLAQSKSAHHNPFATQRPRMYGTIYRSIEFERGKGFYDFLGTKCLSRLAAPRAPAPPLGQRFLSLLTAAHLFLPQSGETRTVIFRHPPSGAGLFAAARRTAQKRLNKVVNDLWRPVGWSALKEQAAEARAGNGEKLLDVEPVREDSAIATLGP